MLTKISRNISTTNTFEGVEFFGMSSYDKYFVGIWKYGSSAFQRTIDHVSMTSSYVSALWNICARKSSKSGVIRQIRVSTWLLASYIAEKCYPTDGSSWILPFSDFFDYINDFWATKRSLEVIKISTDSWDDVLHDPIIYVSRSGKFTAFYIAYIRHIAEKHFTSHTVKSDVGRKKADIHGNTPCKASIF